MDFIPVKRRNRKSKSGLKLSEKSVEDHLNGIQSKADVIKTSRFYQNALSTLNANVTVTHIKCLGLGSVSESTTAAYQLSFLILLIENFKVPTGNVTAWDPLFNENDQQILKELSISIVPNDYGPSGDTLFYMPHTPFSLSDQILELHGHKKLQMLANSWDYLNNVSNEDPHQKYPHIMKAMEDPQWTQIAIPLNLEPGTPNWFLTAFGDTALQFK